MDKIKGTWTLKNGVVTSRQRSLVFGDTTKTVMQKINRNKYITRATHPDGSRTTVIQTRIGK